MSERQAIRLHQAKHPEDWLRQMHADKRHRAFRSKSAALILDNAAMRPSLVAEHGRGRQ